MSRVPGRSIGSDCPCQRHQVGRQEHPTLTVRDGSPPDSRGRHRLADRPAPRETHDSARPEPQDPPRFCLRTAVAERGMVLVGRTCRLQRRKRVSTPPIPGLGRPVVVRTTPGRGRFRRGGFCGGRLHGTGGRRCQDNAGEGDADAQDDGGFCGGHLHGTAGRWSSGRRRRRRFRRSGRRLLPRVPSRRVYSQTSPSPWTEVTLMLSTASPPPLSSRISRPFVSTLCPRWASGLGKT